MRQSLRDTRDKAKSIDSIRTIKGAIEYILWYLSNTSTAESTEQTYGDCIITIDAEDTIEVLGKLYVHVIGDSLG